MSVDRRIFDWQSRSVFDRLTDYVSGLRPLRVPASEADTQEVRLDAFLALADRPVSPVVIRLTDEEAYGHTFDGRTGNLADLRKISANLVYRLSPLSVGDETVLARASALQPGLIDLLHIRTNTLDGIQQKARALGTETTYLETEDGTQGWFLPDHLALRRLEARLRLGAFAALILGLVCLLTGAQNWLDRSLDNALVQEISLRTETARRDATEREIGALGRLAQLRIEDRMPAARLGLLAHLTASTPDTAYWTSLEADPFTIRLGGSSANAAVTLSALSAAYPEQTVRFDQPVSMRADGSQGFVIVIEGLYP